MKLYETYIFGVALDWVMSRPPFTRERSNLLKPLHGDVLEIGFGTGLNLEHYPSTIERLSILDPATLLPGRVQARIEAAGFPVEARALNAEQLPFDSGRFDFVVSTWTLCTIPDPVKALREVRRVLKPDGRFVFIEHGRSDDPQVARWQDLLNPWQKFIAGGCNLNRPIDRLIQQSGLELVGLDRYLMRKTAAIHAPLYRGMAVPG